MNLDFSLLYKFAPNFVESFYATIYGILNPFESPTQYIYALIIEII